MPRTAHREVDKLRLLARALDRTLGDRVGKIARWSGLLAFNYHRIGDASSSRFDRDLWSATAESFAEQMSFLARHFDVIGLDDLKGLSSAPVGRRVVVTFDDGYRDNYEIAFPILRDRRLKAAFFLAVGFLDRRGVAWWDEIAWMVRHSRGGRIPAGKWSPTDLSTAESDQDDTIRRLLLIYKSLPGSRGAGFLEWLGAATGSGRCPSTEASGIWLTWDMVREMRSAGMSIGGHSVTHPVLAHLRADEQAREIDATARRIRQELGEPMRWFAYPVGGRDAFNEDTRRALDRAGVQLAFTYYGGYSRPGEWDRFDVRRIAVEQDIDGPRFRATAALPSLFASPDGAGWRARIGSTIAELMGA